jgi:flagellin-like protein
MKKGITPIIAVIILLLITVALAGMAWSFMSGYVTTMTGKSVQVIDNYCTAGRNAVIVISNVGTESINLGAAPGCTAAGSITGTSATCGELVITRTDGTSMTGSLAASGTLAQRNSTTFTDTACTTTTPKNCQYRIRTTTGTTSNPISVYCSGS